MIADLFALEDESYWSDPWANRKAIQRPLMQSGRESFIIGAPKVVALDRHRTLPLAILRVRKAQGGSPADFRAMAVVAAWDFQSHRLNARLAFPRAASGASAFSPSGSRSAASGSAGSAGGKGDSFSGDASAMIGEASTLDLASRLQLPPASGEYVVSLLCLNEVSNSCRMRVIDSAAFQDEEAEAFLRAYREEQLGPPRIHPEAGAGSTSYHPDSKSPEIPEEIGIALSVQRVTVIRADRPCLVHGSFRLPVPRALPTVASGPKPHPGTGPQTSDPTAIVPIALLLTGSVDPTPLVLNLNVPSYAPLEGSGDEAIATGHFTLDLGAHAPLVHTVQTCFLYAFSGEIMSGPALAAFVNPVMTWKSREELAKEAEAPVV